MAKKLPTNIQEAIAAGEKELAKQAQRDKAAESEKALELLRLEAREKAEQWAREILPKQIKGLTAQGTRELLIGSVEHSKVFLGWGLDVLAKARICEAMGLTVREDSFPADPGEEGMYACDSGYTCTVVW